MTIQPSTNMDRKTVTVIGAGIVGTCCATYVQRLGLKVTMIDRVAPGESCSFGNAGVLSSWSCIPDSVPGIAYSVPGWLLDPEGPLAIRWRYLPQAMPWLLKFIRAGRADNSKKRAVPSYFGCWAKPGSIFSNSHHPPPTCRCLQQLPARLAHRCRMSDGPAGAPEADERRSKRAPLVPPSTKHAATCPSPRSVSGGADTLHSATA